MDAPLTTISLGTISRNRANNAGKILRAGAQSVSPEEYQLAIDTAQAWRDQHIEATQECFSEVLKCSNYFAESVCTYRLKRIASIIRKLQRAQTHLKLGELDDIGGCRLILETNNQVRQAAEILKSQIPLKKGSGEKTISSIRKSPDTDPATFCSNLRLKQALIKWRYRFEHSFNITGQQLLRPLEKSMAPNTKAPKFVDRP